MKSTMMTVRATLVTMGSAKMASTAMNVSANLVSVVRHLHHLIKSTSWPHVGKIRIETFSSSLPLRTSM